MHIYMHVFGVCLRIAGACIYGEDVYALHFRDVLYVCYVSGMFLCLCSSYVSGMYVMFQGCSF